MGFSFFAVDILYILCKEAIAAGKIFLNLLAISYKIVYNDYVVYKISITDT